MKKKIRIKGLPKAQFAGQRQPSMVLTPEQQDIWRANQNMFGTPPQQPIAVPDYTGSTNTTPSITQGMTPFSVVPPTMKKPFNSSNTFGPGALTMPRMAPSVTPLLNDVDQFNEPFGPLTASDYYANVAEQYTASPEGTTFTDDAAFAPGYAPQSQNPAAPKSQFARFAPFIASEAFSSLGRSKERRQAQQNFKNRFLADAMYNPLPSDYSGMRGDYVTNQGLGINFRPDEAVYGQFGKIAKYGGQMKRKIKITGLPQQAYGGTQNKASIDEMYPYNSNVRRAAYSNMLDGDPEQSVKQYAEEVPREIANIEAERGETIVKPLDNGLLGMYKIGGKRHYEGGTPLQATPNDFIFSDTKDMRIKDPAILESFGMSVNKKGKKGYTPAAISKKFNLNDPNIQKTLNDPDADYIAKNTAERMYDNYLSQLGKLALVQEGRKGFPQGAPDISMPYMQKVGMDPSMFMPDVMTPQDASFQMGKAQFGQQGFDADSLMQRPQTQPYSGFNPFAQSSPSVSTPVIPATTAPVSTPAVSNTPTTSYTSFDPSSIYGSESYITRYGKPTNGKVRVMLDPNASYEDKVRLAEEATTLNFGKKTKAPIQQGKTEGYKYFYAGLTPSDFEKRYLQGFMDMEDIESLTPIERRKKLFSELGINASDAELNDPKSLYNNQEWLKNTFYPAFKKKLPEDQFRSVMGDDFMFGLEHFDNIPKRQTKAPGTPETSTPAPGPRANVIPEQEPAFAEPGKYYIQDLMNTGLAGADRLGLNKYLPYDVGMPAAALMDPTFYDPSRELAATGEMANMVTQNLAQFTGPQALSSRASQIQGNAAKAVADTLGRYNNLNVGVANQFEQLNKSIINDFNTKNALAKSNFYDKTVVANQQYDNAKRAANARLMQQSTNAITNKAMTQVLNSMYPEYAVDPTVGGEMMYVPSQRSTTGDPLVGSQMGTSDVIQNMNQLRKQFENDPEFQKLTPDQKFQTLSKFIPRESSMTRRYDPRYAFFANMLRSNRR